MVLAALTAATMTVVVLKAKRPVVGAVDAVAPATDAALGAEHPASAR
jgi:hypothetical protein